MTALPAQTTPRRGGLTPQFDPWLLSWHYLALLGFVLFALLVVFFITRWRKRMASDRQSASDQLSEFRTLYEQGQLSREEFERVRGLLGKRMRKELERPAAGSAEPERRAPPASSPPTPDSSAPGGGGL